MEQALGERLVFVYRLNLLVFFFSFLVFFLLCGMGGVAMPDSQLLRCTTCTQHYIHRYIIVFGGCD